MEQTKEEQAGLPSDMFDRYDIEKICKQAALEYWKTDTEACYDENWPFRREEESLQEELARLAICSLLEDAFKAGWHQREMYDGSTDRSRRIVAKELDVEHYDFYEKSPMRLNDDQDRWDKIKESTLPPWEGQF